jgi:glutamate synthase (NADPH/NADH) small chain
MYGIPNMKLEKHIIDRKIKVMQEEGVIFKTDTNVGKTVKADQLLKEFDRVVLCCGASNPRDINAPGRDAKGIYFAVDFLKRNTKSLLDSDFKDKQFVDTKDKDVVIIGGGDTGNDCVGTAIRHGAKSVTQIEMMPKAPDKRAENNPWPEWPKVCKTDYGQQEAIAVYGHDPRIYESTVKEFIKDKNGNLKAVKIVSLTWEKDPATGRMNMKEVAGSEKLLDAQIVLIAAGFLGSEKYVTDAFKVELDGRTNVKTQSGKFASSTDKVFTAGDMHTGQSLVVKAIRQGRECAREVDESLMGYTNMGLQ